MREKIDDENKKHHGFRGSAFFAFTATGQGTIPIGTVLLVVLNLTISANARVAKVISATVTQTVPLSRIPRQPHKEVAERREPDKAESLLVAVVKLASDLLFDSPECGRSRNLFRFGLCHFDRGCLSNAAVFCSLTSASRNRGRGAGVAVSGTSAKSTRNCCALKRWPLREPLIWREGRSLNRA